MAIDFSNPGWAMDLLGGAKEGIGNMMNPPVPFSNRVPEGMFPPTPAPEMPVVMPPEPPSGAGGMGPWNSPQMASTMVNSPNQVAAAAAQQNVDPATFFRGMAPEASLGDSLNGQQTGDSRNPFPAPVGDRQGNPFPTPIGSPPPPGTPMGNKILDTLKGLKAPGAPAQQKVSTPSAAAPRPSGQIKGGDLMQLMQMMSQGGGGGGLPSLGSRMMGTPAGRRR